MSFNCQHQNEYLLPLPLKKFSSPASLEVSVFITLKEDRQVINQVLNYEVPTEVFSFN